MDKNAAHLHCLSSLTRIDNMHCSVEVSVRCPYSVCKMLEPQISFAFTRPLSLYLGNCTWPLDFGAGRLFRKIIYKEKLRYFFLEPRMVSCTCVAIVSCPIVSRECLAGSLMPIGYPRRNETVDFFPRGIRGDSISPTNRAT
jgi:hypothetical protein